MAGPIRYGLGTQRGCSRPGRTVSFRLPPSARGPFSSPTRQTDTSGVRTRNVVQPPVLGLSDMNIFKVGKIEPSHSRLPLILPITSPPHSHTPLQQEQTDSTVSGARTDSTSILTNILALHPRLLSTYTQSTMKTSLLCASLAATTATAFPLFSRRSPLPAPAPKYNVVSVDGHDTPSSQPLQQRAPEPEPKPITYSVVPVDGGPNNNGAGGGGGAQPATRTETLYTTRLSTIVVTESETPATIVITVTEEQGAAPTLAPQQPQNGGGNPAPPAQPQATVTVTQDGDDKTQTRPYDNGMWHTTYYYTTSVPSSTSSPPSASPTSPPSSAAEKPSAQQQVDPTTNQQEQSGDDASAEYTKQWQDAAWMDHDVAPGMPGVQVVGTADETPNTDPDRAAKLDGQWAPWAGDAGSQGAGGGQGQGQDQQGGRGGTGS